MNARSEVPPFVLCSRYMTPDLSGNKLKPRQFSKLRQAFVLVALLYCPYATCQAPSDNLRIVYTGKLLGYYRLEIGEAQQNPEVLKPGYYQNELRKIPAGLPPVQSFFESLGSTMQPRGGELKPLLLGMGDNFAPEFGSTVQLENSSSCGCLLPPTPKRSPSGKGKKVVEFPKSLYKDWDRLPKFVYCDNVLNFFLDAGYRAVVPGREDFLYGAWWLHTVAAKLRDRTAYIKTNKLRDEQALSLLAANLRATVKLKTIPQEGTAPKDSGKLCPLLFDRDLIASSEQCTEAGVPVLLDWLNRLDRALATDSSTGFHTAWWRLFEQTTKESSRTRATEDTIWLRQTLLANETSSLEAMLPKGEDYEDNKKWRIKFDVDNKDLSCTEPDPSGRLQSDVGCLLRKLVSIDTNLAKPNLPNRQKSYQEQHETAKQLGSQLGNICSGKQTERDGLVCHVGKALVTKYCEEAEIYGKSYITGSQTPSLDIPVLEEARKALLWSIYDSEKEVGFTNVRLKDANNGDAGMALVIGIVGQETMNAISSENKAICYKKAGADQEQDAGDPATPEVVDCDDPQLKPTDTLYEATTKVFPPLPAVEAILRAADVVKPYTYKYRIVMAQMPQTQAEELAARLRENVGAPSVKLPPIDLMLSEAQPDHSSPNMTLQYDYSFVKGNWPVTPVVSPRPTWDSSPEGPTWDPSREGVVRPDSSVTIATTLEFHAFHRQVTNEANTHALWFKDEGTKTMVSVLMDAVERAKQSTSDSQKLFNGLKAANCSGDTASEECRLSVMQFVLKRMQVRGRSDVAMLENRDIYLGKLITGYDDDAGWCPNSYEDSLGQVVKLTPEQVTDCQLRVALDRVLWKGDYYERVMVSGKDLATLMKTAAEQADQEQTLMPRDTVSQWLVTYGIVTTKPNVLTRSGVRSYEFSVPQSPFCADADEEKNPSAGGKTLYCVNGLPLQSDHTYSVVTTDHLAEDSAVYTTIAGLTSDYRERLGDFLVNEISNTLVPRLKGGTSEIVQKDDPSGAKGRNLQEVKHQVRDLFQVDIGKAVLGYSFRQPQGGDAYVARNFQGVTDSRASSAHQSELDVEEKSRVQWKRNRFALGVQTDMVYDRSVLGNLSGNPANASYPLNNVSVGGFLQWNLHLQHSNDAARSAPHNLPGARYSLVFAPYQYQRQINGNYLFFPFSSPSKQELTLQAPPVNGFSQRAGFRWEAAAAKRFTPFDKGTYVEVGGQLTVQNNVLAAVTLTTTGQSKPLVCDSSGAKSISTCFVSQKYPVNSSTAATAAVETLHGGGLYWDIHLQKGLVKLPDASSGISLVVDTRGDKFFNREIGKALSTQTLYDVPLSVALTFPLFRNLTFAPTYSTFFYANQILDQSLVVNSFAVNLRWYFDRDSAVPLFRQLLFKGPASADETKTAKVK